MSTAELLRTVSKAAAAAQQAQKALPRRRQLAAMRQVLDTAHKAQHVVAQNRGALEQAAKAAPHVAAAKRCERRARLVPRRIDRRLTCVRPAARPAARATTSGSRDGPGGDDPHQQSEDDDPPRPLALVPRREWRDWARRRAPELARLLDPMRGCVA